MVKHCEIHPMVWKKPVKKSAEKNQPAMFCLFTPGPPNNKFNIVGNGDFQLVPM